jgi:pantothenate synthetase
MVAKKSLKSKRDYCPIYREANDLAMSSRNAFIRAGKRRSIYYLQNFKSVKEQFSKK